jgi:DNA-binding GntR family transcriptional regulator
VTDTESTPLRDVIADALRIQIINGAIKPGRRVREEEIALDHGVSRVPVREALQRLAAEGYVELTPRRGATVVVPDQQRVLGIMEIRRVLEVLAVRGAARAGGGAVAKQLAAVVERGHKAATSQRNAQIPALVDEFHDLIAVASGNSELVQLLAQIRTKVRWMFEVDLDERATASWDDHRRILEAIVGRDEDEAARQMDAHVARDEAHYRHVVGPASSEGRPGRTP